MEVMDCMGIEWIDGISKAGGLGTGWEYKDFFIECSRVDYYIDSI
jgi:hypothetical protein